MQTPRITRVVVIQNSQGLHARPADLFARLASQFECQIEVLRDDRRVHASSVIDLLTLGAVQGTELVLEAEGVDADQALEALASLVAKGFDEDQPCDPAEQP
jgi:phosphocarrier protein HPr